MRASRLGWGSWILLLLDGMEEKFIVHRGVPDLVHETSNRNFFSGYFSTLPADPQISFGLADLVFVICRENKRKVAGPVLIDATAL